MPGPSCMQKRWISVTGSRDAEWDMEFMPSRPPVHLHHLWAPLNIQRAEAREKIFRQMKQDSARVVDPTRRNVVKYDGKDSAEISCDEFLEMPLYI